ncbi:MAG: heme ABC exporter ATP-binding protein CcmA [Myxococcota bacterium]
MPEIVIDDVARRYGRRWALAHVQLRIEPGQAWMLLGHNGSGKSTLLRCLATAQRVHHGQIRYGGRNLWDNRSELREKISVLGHAPALYDDLSAMENLSVWAALGGFAGVDLGAALARVGLDPGRKEPVRAFSAGMRRRVALARMLLKKPELVLLDEPFTALDPGGRELLIGVIRDLRDAGATLVLATHLPKVAQAVAEHAVILDEGKVVFRGRVDELPPGLAFE